jgi:hypothetical protein
MAEVIPTTAIHGGSQFLNLTNVPDKAVIVDAVQAATVFVDSGVALTGADDNAANYTRRQAPTSVPVAQGSRLLVRDAGVSGGTAQVRITVP